METMANTPYIKIYNIAECQISEKKKVHGEQSPS